MIKDTTNRLQAWLRDLHGRGMSINVIKFERDPATSFWTAYASHSGLGSASSRQTGGSLADPVYEDHAEFPGVKQMILTKPKDQRIRLGLLTRPEMVAVIEQLRAVTGSAAHDVWDLPDLPDWISMRTWGLDRAAKRDLGQERIMGLMTGRLIARSGSIKPVTPDPEVSNPISTKGRRMSVLRPCGCVTHHWQPARKSNSDMRKFGVWLTARPCNQCHPEI